MKLNNLKVSSNSKFKKKNRSMYFKKRNSHLFKSKSNRFHSKFNVNSNEFNYKLPILTCIELVDEQSKLTSTSNESINSTSFSSSMSSVNSCLFNDYLLISSKTKYKYLLYTLFEQVDFDFKDNYTIIDGYLQLKNWEPIALSSISSINQCLKSFENRNNSSTDKTISEQDVNTNNDINSAIRNGDVSINGQIRANSINGDLQYECSSSSSVCSSNDSYKKNKLTVYDILSHVVSFASIKIRVKHKSDVMSNNMQSQTCNNESIQQVESKTTEVDQHNSVLISDKNDEENYDEDKQVSIDDTEKSDNVKPVPNLSSMLYSNPQLANLLPLFNLPILSQLLNGIKNHQEQKEFSAYNEDKPEQESNQQPLNLCKETSKTVNNKKINQNLMINTNSKTHNFGLNNNTSPSPSLSSTSSTSSSSSYNKVQHQVKSIESTQSLNSKFTKDSQLNEKIQSKISFGNSSNRRQRERTTFDPQEEITRLMQVFEKTHHPTRFQIANICDFLNLLPCRKDKKPLEPYNIQYWFKNARAALRRKVKGDSQNQNSGFDMTAKLSNSVKDEEFLTKILNTRPQSVDSKFQPEANDLNGNQSDVNYDDSNIDEDELNDDEDLNLNENCDSNYDYQTSNEFQENQSESEVGLKNETENYDQNENNNSFNDDCDFQDDLSYDGDECNQEAVNVEGKILNNGISVSKSASRNSSGGGNRRNRVFIDPISEVPILEHYFSIETYPDHYLIEKICENLNKGEYRYKFPKLESRNIQLWFKNHRAKLKRLKTNTSSSNLNQSNPVS